MDELMHRGWFKVWRKWQDHEVAADPNAWAVLTHMLCETRRHPKENRRYGYTLERGQCDLTTSQLEERAGLTSQEVREALGRLVKYGTIQRTTQKGRQPVITTIVNYELYNPASPDTTPIAPPKTTPVAPQEQHLSNGQTTTPLEVKTVETVESSTTTLPANAGEQKTRKVKTYSASFEEWWALYPSAIRDGKGKAAKAWERLAITDQQLALGAVAVFAAIVNAAPADRRRFYKRPESWLNAASWDTDPEVWRENAKADRAGASRMFATRAEQGDKFHGIGS